MPSPGWSSHSEPQHTSSCVAREFRYAFIYDLPLDWVPGISFPENSRGINRQETLSAY